MPFDIKVGAAREVVRPLALLPMRGFETMGQRVNEYLLRWTTDPETETLLTFPVLTKTAFN